MAFLCSDVSTVLEMRKHLGTESVRLIETKNSRNRSLELRETVLVGSMIPNTANSVYKIQRQLFARSERVKGIDFHPVEPWILTTLYSGMYWSVLDIRTFAHLNLLQVMSTFGHTRHRYAPQILALAKLPLTTHRR